MFIDVTINRTDQICTFQIYRKPTFTDSIIPYDSCHPPQHKLAAIRYLHNRLHSYNLAPEEKSKELNIIHNILYNNAFHLNIYKSTSQKTKNSPHTEQTRQKWATFTYFGKMTNLITRIFKNTDVKIAYRTRNSLGSQLGIKPPEIDIYSRSGIYKLNCQDCGKKYVGQTGRSFTKRFKEHLHSYRTNNTNSNFAQHLNENNHNMGTKEETMEIIHFQQKGKHLNTMEKFHIYIEALTNNHLNDQHTVNVNNKIFEVIHNNNNIDI